MARTIFSGGDGITCFQKSTATATKSACSRACRNDEVSVASNNGGMCQPISTTANSARLTAGVPSHAAKRESGPSGRREKALASARGPERQDAEQADPGRDHTTSGAQTIISSTCWVMWTQKSRSAYQ